MTEDKVKYETEREKQDYVLPLTKQIAWILAKQHGLDPSALEPGDLPRVDAVLPNGDKAHFKWRHFVDDAEAIIKAIRKQQ